MKHEELEKIISEQIKDIRKLSEGAVPEELVMLSHAMAELVRLNAEI